MVIGIFFMVGGIVLFVFSCIKILEYLDPLYESVDGPIRIVKATFTVIIFIMSIFFMGFGAFIESAAESYDSCKEVLEKGDIVSILPNTSDLSTSCATIYYKNKKTSLLVKKKINFADFDKNAKSLKLKKEQWYSYPTLIIPYSYIRQDENLSTAIKE